MKGKNARKNAKRKRRERKSARRSGRESARRNGKGNASGREIGNEIDAGGGVTPTADTPAERQTAAGAVRETGGGPGVKNATGSAAGTFHIYLQWKATFFTSSLCITLALVQPTCCVGLSHRLSVVKYFSWITLLVEQEP